MRKANLILIHGALGTGKELMPLADELKDAYTVHIYEIPGHGARSNELASFNLDTIREDFNRFLVGIGPCYIFGFSLGGYLALSCAQQKNEFILGVVTLGTKLNWSPEIAEHEVKSLDIAFLQTKVTGFYQYLYGLHDKHLPELLLATADFMRKLGDNPALPPQSVSAIDVPVRIVRGGKDKMVSAAESRAIAAQIPNGRYFEIPHFIHPLGFLKAKSVANMIRVQLLSCDYGFFQLDNKEIAYYQNDKQATYRLLFLHEALGSIAQWKDFPNQLGNTLGLPTTLVEMKGYGFSSAYTDTRHADYLHRFAWDDLPQIIAGLAPQEKLIFVGHSDGGSIALLFAAKHPEKIAGVVTLAAHIRNEKETREGIPPAVEAFESGKLKGLEIYHGDKTEKLFYDWADTWLADFFHDWNIEKDINGIAVPGLIMQGNEDQYGTAAQVKEISNCFNAPVTQLLIPDCGHAPHHEQRETVISAIQAWYNNEFPNE